MSAIDLSKLHECESISLRLPHAVSPEVILKSLSKLGFKACDDFCFLPRKDKAKPWHSEHVTDVTFFLDDSEVHHYFDADDDEEGELLCNHLVFDFLFAAQPPEIADEFLKSLHSVHSALGGTLEHGGRSCSIDEIRQSFALYQEDVWNELAEVPGSEFLVQFIASSYPPR
ncbi:MAG: hypothetical protein U1F81_22005 [Verrucomicrobiaceae bacterium]